MTGEVKLSLSREKLEKYIEDICGLNRRSIPMIFPRISSNLLVSMVLVHNDSPLNIHNIVAEIRYLEGLILHTKSKAESKFDNSSLKGLMKKHFYDPVYFLKNVGASYNLAYEAQVEKNKLQGIETEKTKKEKEKEKEKPLLKMATEHMQTLPKKEVIERIVYDLTIGDLKAREEAGKKLTGEWLVYKKYNGKNYYLTLANHKDSDEEILSRVNMAYTDFSFLIC